MTKHRSPLLLSPDALPGPNNILRETLPNGLTVLIRENPVSPSVVVSGYLLAGAEDEPREKRGLASLTADVMGQGTHQRSLSRLYEEIESIGASFGVAGSTHLTLYGAKGLGRHLGLLLDILADVLQNPRFEPQEIEKAREEALTAMREHANDTRYTTRRRLRQLVYPSEHPYHRDPTGDPEALCTLSREDLLAFHTTYITPQNGALVIVGDVQSQAALETATRVFGSWQRVRPPRQPPCPVPSIGQQRQDHVTLADKSQVSFRMGWIGPSRYHPDYLVCHVTNTILGVFGMYGRLGKCLRAQHSLAYSVSSQVNSSPYPGLWSISAGLDPKAVQQAKALIIQEIQKLQDQPVSSQEMEDAQAYLVGKLPLALETNEGIASSLMGIERYGLGLDYLQRYGEMIYAIRPQDVQRTAQSWLDTDHYVQVTAGPPWSGSRE